MFGLNDKDTKSVYKIWKGALFLLTVPISITLIIALYLSFPMLILPLSLGFNFLATSWFIIFFYTFGVRIVSLSAPYTSFATFSMVTPFSVGLVTIFLVSGLLFTIFIWDSGFLESLRTVEGYERYRDVKRLIFFLLRKGTKKDKIMVALNPLLSVALFSLLTLWILNMILLYQEWITSTFIFLIPLFSLLYVFYTFKMKEFIRDRAIKVNR